ncbi:MAG: hypothetical protein AAFV80_12955, partial [Bacteroidota bacterium]
MLKALTNLLSNIPDIGRYGLVVGVIVFISFLFPNTVQFKYDYEEGKTWVYSDLEANFDFAIRKDETVIGAEIARIRENFIPIYSLDLEMIDRSSKDFLDAIGKLALDQTEDPILGKLNEHRDRILQAAIKVFNKVYQNGVIPDSLSQNRKPDYTIRLLQKNVIEERAIKDLPTLQAAKGTLVDEWYLGPKAYQTKDILKELLECVYPNVMYNDSLNQAKYQELLNNEISYHRGKVDAGQVIVHRGDLITEEIYLQLKSYETEYLSRISKNKDSLLIRAGHFILTAMLISMFVVFLHRNAPKVTSSYRQMTFLLGWIALFSYIVYIGVRTEMLNLYVLPFCIVPIVVKAFYNARLALFIHVVIILIASFLSPLGFEFTFVQLMAGIAAVLANFKMRSFSSFFLTVLYILLTYQLTYLSLTLIREGSLFAIEWPIHGWLALNVFLTLLSYPLIPLTERLFGYTSEITLVELSDLNRPLLRELSLKAPATLQHSLQVGNSCEAACNAFAPIAV